MKYEDYFYKLYIYLRGMSADGPYCKHELYELIPMLDNLILNDKGTLSHILIIKHDVPLQMDSTVYLNYVDKENYIQFRETCLVDKPKVLTKGMKKCNMKYGVEVEKQKYTNL